MNHIKNWIFYIQLYIYKLFYIITIYMWCRALTSATLHSGGVPSNNWMKLRISPVSGTSLPVVQRQLNPLELIWNDDWVARRVMLWVTPAGGGRRSAIKLVVVLKLQICNLNLTSWQRMKDEPSNFHSEEQGWLVWRNLRKRPLLAISCKNSPNQFWWANNLGEKRIFQDRLNYRCSSRY